MVVGALIGVIGDDTLGTPVHWFAGAGILITLVVPLYVLWRKYLRSGRGRHGRP